MIELWHCPDTRSFRPLWALEELGLSYELHLLPFPPRARTPEYLQVNPLGTIPLYIEGEARMTESSMTCHWLATRHDEPKLRVDPGEPGHAAYLNFVSYGEATLTFPLAVRVRYTQVEPPERRLAQAAEDYTRFFYGRLKLVEPVLQSNTWLCGDRFTAADISVGYALRLARNLGVADTLKPQLKAYLDRLEQRPAFQRALAAEDQPEMR